MKIEDKFRFGKYKNLTLKEVYQGTPDINRELLKGYLKEKLSTAWHSAENPDDFVADILGFEISDTLIRATPISDEFRGNHKVGIEKLFRNRTSLAERLYGFFSLDDFNLDKFSSDKTKPEITSGNPGYVEWCIKNVDNFYVYPSELEELQDLKVYKFLGIEVHHKTEDIYEYNPKIDIRYMVYEDDLIELNYDKYSSNIRIQKNEWQGDIDQIAKEGFYEENCPACHESPCMCSDPFNTLGIG